jgi:hypothetical protein
VNASDYIFSAIFIALIFRQVRGRPLTVKSLLVPVAVVVGFAIRYLRDIPTAGNDLKFTVVCASAGVILGCASGLATTVRAGPDGRPIARAGPLAILLWVLGTGSRLAFGLYALHGGGPEIARLSATYHIIGRDAYATAFILMALCEVAARYGLLGLRATAIRRGQPEAGRGRKPDPRAPVHDHGFHES